MNAVLSEAPLDSTSLTHTIAARFSRAAHHYDRYATVQQQIASAAINSYPWRTDDTVLDIGAGTGCNTQYIATQVTSAVGLDISPGMVAEAVRRYPALTFIEGDAEALPFDDAQFSVVFSSMALQWCASPARVLNEINRVLKPGGKAVLAIMVAGSFTELGRAQQIAQCPDTLMPLASADCWLQHALASPLAIETGKQASYTGEFTDIMALLRSISRVGASVSRHAHRPMTRRNISALASAYQTMLTPRGTLPLTYQLLHIQLEKK